MFRTKYTKIYRFSIWYLSSWRAADDPLNARTAQNSLECVISHIANDKHFSVLHSISKRVDVAVFSFLSCQRHFILTHRNLHRINGFIWPCIRLWFVRTVGVHCPWFMGKKGNTDIPHYLFNRKIFFYLQFTLLSLVRCFALRHKQIWWAAAVC